MSLLTQHLFKLKCLYKIKCVYNFINSDASLGIMAGFYTCGPNEALIVSGIVLVLLVKT